MLIPFVDRVVPIIADAVVEPGFGTGAVKITPAHDHDDFATGRRHGLPIIDVMTDDGHMNDAARAVRRADPRGGPRRASWPTSRRAATWSRRRPHEMVVGHCERSDDVVEPRIKTQWFINVKPMAELAMAAVREGRTRFVSQRFEKTFFDWMEDIHDWNVSRQLWWGHRIPAWYCPDGHVTVSERRDGPDRCADVRAARGRAAPGPGHLRHLVLERPVAVLAPSAGRSATADLDRYYPGTVMETGYDIIFFWVARMMMLGEWLTGREPFGIVYLHGMVRDPDGAKMSKTRGNVVDPLGVIDEVGADALRFALVNGTAPGMDQRLSPEPPRGRPQLRQQALERQPLRARRSARRSCPPTPSWRCPARPTWAPPSTGSWPAARRRSREVDAAYASFQFAEATRLLHAAIWSEYCDWYLELAKTQLAPERPVDDAGRDLAGARLGARPVPAAAPPGDAPHHGAHLGAPAQEPRRPGPAHRGALAGRGRGGWLPMRLDRGRRGRAAGAHHGHPQRPHRRGHRRQHLARGDGRAPHRRRCGTRSRVWTRRSRGWRASGWPSPTTRPCWTRCPTPWPWSPTRAEARLAATEGDRERDRARVERELAEARQHLEAARARLADPRFTERAPAAVVEGARQRAQELEDRVAAPPGPSRTGPTA